MDHWPTLQLITWRAAPALQLLSMIFLPVMVQMALQTGNGILEMEQFKISAALLFQHTYNTPGTFSVKLKVTDAVGCSDSITINNLVIATDPVPDFISADTLVCPGSTVNFTNTSAPAGFTSQWDFGDGGTSTTTFAFACLCSNRFL